MFMLADETAKLHTVMWKYLSQATAENLMGQGLVVIDKKLASEFMALEIRNQGARERMVKDIEYLNSQMSTLKGLRWTGSVSYGCSCWN